MSYPAIYTIIEEGKVTNLYASHGANTLTPMLRLKQAYEIRENSNKPVTDILKGLDYEGVYRENRDVEEEFVFRSWEQDPEQCRIGHGIQMFITLDLDKQLYHLDFNKNYPLYISMGKFSDIPIEKGMKIMELAMLEGEKVGKTSFFDVLFRQNEINKFNQALEASKADYELQQSLSPSINEGEGRGINEENITDVEERQED